MNTIYPQLGSATLAALAKFQAAHPGSGTLQDILDEAVQDWLARQAPAAGYRWKCLFLPSGTKVRIEYNGDTTHAHVVGDRLICRGRAVSPRQMLLDVTGLSSNAWQWLFVCRPGDPCFVRASTLRARQERAAETLMTPPSALERRLTAAVEQLERLGHAAKERRRNLRRMADYEQQD